MVLIRADTDPELVLRSHAEKELAWIRKYGRKQHPFYREYAESFGYKKQDPQDHIHSLEDYLRLVPHLIPKDATVHSPTLRHPDLSPNNIMISDDLQITGFIDWQHSEVLPAFLAADIPGAEQASLAGMHSQRNFHDTSNISRCRHSMGR